MNIGEIGKYIRYLRNKNKLTQSQLGKILSVSNKAISKWESGLGLPEIETLLKISDYFKITVDDLLRAKFIENVHTEFLYILDASGSMYGVTDDVIGGFNSFLSDQKSLKDQAYLTTVVFNHNVNSLYKSKDIKLVDDINRRTYKASGSTSLFDAIGSAVFSLQERTKTEKVMVIIMTDGYENSSRIFTGSKIKKIIEEKTEEGWEFIFAGANIDVDKVSDSIGIKKNRRMVYISDKEGTKEIYSRMSKMTSDYRLTGDLKVQKKGKKNV